MANVKRNKAKQEVKGWQMLLIAAVFIVIGRIMGGAVGSFIEVGGYLFFLLSIARFVAESRAKKQAGSDKTSV